MARAMVQYERDDSATFVPVGVWLATAKRLQARMLPGSASRDAFMKYVLADASRPTAPYSTTKLGWPDWIEWATWSLSDGHIRMMREVEPEVTLDQMYAIYVLGDAKAGPMHDPKHQPTADIPAIGRELKSGIGNGTKGRVKESDDVFAQADEKERWVETIREYNDDQPRDDHGRWAAGGGDSAKPWPEPDTSKEGIDDATSAWSGVHYADVRSYMREGSVREGMDEKSDPIHGISDERAAQAASTLTEAVANG